MKATPSALLRGLALLLVLPALGRVARAQTQGGTPDPAFSTSEALRARRPPQPVAEPRQDEAAPVGVRTDARAEQAAHERAVEVAFGPDAVWLALRGAADVRLAWLELGLLVSDDSDVLVSGRLMHYGRPGGSPVTLGIGLEGLVGFLQSPSAQAYGLGIAGSVSYEIPTAFRSRARLSLGYAPHQLLLADADHVLDVGLDYEVDVSESASFFAGYRHLEVGLEHRPDQDLDSSVHFGVRLGF